MSVIKVINTKTEFDRSIKNNRIAVVDFFAHWCGPCKMLSPFIDELSKKYKNISFFKIDIDKLNDVANQYQISSIPTILIFKNTKLINTLVGFNSKEKINSILNKIK